MKKLHSIMKNFLIKHYKLGVTISILIFICCSIGLVYAEIKPLVALGFGFSLAALMRLITYKTGKIPIFMKDSIYNSYRRKYSGEELDQKYEEMSINHATTLFIISIPSALLWGICETIAFLIYLSEKNKILSLSRCNVSKKKDK